jgi:hypothetical protein
MRKHLESSVGDDGFSADIADLYVQEVEAAMEEIRARLRGPGFARSLMKGLAQASPPGILGLAVVSALHWPAVVSVALGGVVGAYAVSDERRQRQLEAEQHELFFLYKAGRLLS